MTGTTLTMRALVSAADPLARGQLECEIRERIAPALHTPADGMGIEGRGAFAAAEGRASEPT